MSNKKLIKNLLTSASALAVLATGTSAFAAEVFFNQNAGDVTLGNAARTYDTAGANLGGVVPNNADHTYILALSAGGNRLTLDQNHAVPGKFTIDLNKQSGAVVRLGLADQNILLQNTDLGLVTNAAAYAAAANMGGVIGGAVPVAAAPNVQTAQIQLGNFAGNLVGGLELVNKISFANNANSALNIKVEGVLGSANGAEITTINPNDGKLNIDVTGAAANATKTVTFGSNNGVVTLGAVIDSINVKGHNKLVLAKATDLKANGANNGTILEANSSLEVKDTAQAGDVTAITANSVVTISSTHANAADTVKLNNGAIANISAGKTAQVEFTGANASKINLSGGTITKITDVLNSTNILTVSGDSTVGQLGDANAIGSVNFAADNKLTLDNGGAHAAKAITTSNDGEGSIYLAQDLTVETVGADKMALKNITFAANQTLTVSGKTFAVKTVDGLGGGMNAAQGTVVFQEDVDLSGVIFGSTDGKAVSEITLGKANKTAIFGDSLKNVALVKFTNNDAKATISSVGNKAMTIDANGPGNGQLTFDNKADLEVAKLGFSNELGVVKLNGAGVKVSSNDVNHSKIAKLVFGKDSQATLEVFKLNNIAAYEAEGNGVGVVAFRDDSQLAADLGAADHGIQALSFVGTVDKTLDLNTKSTFGAVVTAAKADTLIVTGAGSNAADTTYGGFGAKDARVKSLAFNGAGRTATVKGNVFSKDITTIAGTKIKFEKTVDGVDGKGAFTITGAATEVTFADGASLLNIKTDGANDGEGKLTFEGSHTVGLIGTAKKVASMDFKGAAGKTITITDSIIANAGLDVKFAAATVELQKAATIGGKVTATGTTFNIGTNNLTFTEAPTLTGANVVTSYNGTTLGLVDAGAANDATVDKLTFVVAGSRAAPGKTVDAVFTAKNAKTLLEGGKLAVADQKGFTKWSFAQGSADTNVKLVASDNTAAFVEAQGLSRDLAALFSDMNVTATGEASKLLDSLQNWAAVDPAKVTESIARLTASAAPATATSAAAASVATAVSSRMASVAMPSDAPSAGDEPMGFGLWAQGFGSKATQKARKGDAGYKGTVMGGTVGADTMVSDSSMVGIAVSYASSELKFKDAKAGDKTKSNNMFFSVYGRHTLANDWFVQGNAAFGSGNVKANMKTAMLTAASAKYDTMAFSMEALAGYNYKLSNVATLVPAVGLSYLNVNEGGYTEKGTVGRTITKKSADKFTAIAGATVQGGFDMSGSYVTPEVHAFVNYDLKAKNPTVEAKIDGYSKGINVTAAKAAKVNYNLGTSLTARTGMVEYGVGYDAKLANKFVSHQGTLRLRVDL